MPVLGDEAPQVGMRTNDGADEILYDFHFVSPNYFSVMGIELLAGRDLSPQDDTGSRPVVIVSEDFVERFFPEGMTAQGAVGLTTGPLLFYETGTSDHRGCRTRHPAPATPPSPSSRPSTALSRNSPLTP